LYRLYFEVMRMSSPSYAPVTPGIIQELQHTVGERYVVANDAEQLENYSHDEVKDPHYAHLPEVVVKPETAEEISAVLKLANRERIPVTPRGAGSGLAGGAVPVYGGIVLSVERMNRVLEIDPANMMITVEAGMVTSHINDVLKEYGLFYAGYPMSLETCFIGGNVAHNAGGGKAVKYGVTKRYVHGLEMVLPTGEIIQLGGKRVKNVTGYNLLQLLVGSEGTLGVFTKITLKLLPCPKSSVALLVLFKGAQEAMDSVPVIMTETGIIPTAYVSAGRMVYVCRPHAGGCFNGGFAHFCGNLYGILDTHSRRHSHSPDFLPAGRRHGIFVITIYKAFE
jgi:glycolate oxidase